MTLTEPGAAHRSLVAQNASPPRLPSPDCERSIVGGHAILRAFLPVFRAARGFFRLPSAFFLVLPAALTGDLIPARAVSQRDGGHAAMAGCAQLLLLSAAERLCFFGSRPQGIPESFWLTYPQCDMTLPFQAVQFWPLGDNTDRHGEDEGGYYSRRIPTVTLNYQ